MRKSKIWLSPYPTICEHQCNNTSRKLNTSKLCFMYEVICNVLLSYLQDSCKRYTENVFYLDLDPNHKKPYCFKKIFRNPIKYPIKSRTLLIPSILDQENLDTFSNHRCCGLNICFCPQNLVFHIIILEVIKLSTWYTALISALWKAKAELQFQASLGNWVKV